jgi:transcriptional regulator of arginine metabolism
MHIIAGGRCQPCAAGSDIREARIPARLTRVVLACYRRIARAHGELRRVNKKRRQQVILELVAAQPVASQEELRQLLDDRGFAVTQSTLSRDLRELRLARIPTPQGARYASPDALADDHRTALEDVLPQFFESSDGVGELLVLKTIAGGAQPIAEAIDAQAYPDVLGTIGGENTILIICRASAARDRLERRLERLARSGA